MTDNSEHIDENMVRLEVNLDDISGEWLGHVMDKLFDAGARDLYYVPIYMKKNRPGVMLQLLCNRSEISVMETILFSETTTLGVRYVPMTVHRLERRFCTVKTRWGEVSVKEGLYAGEVVQKSPEFEECRRLAVQNGVPLKEIYEEVWRKL
jgi:uncharacterized protein (DUF111 family)